MERMKVKYVIDGKDYVTLPAYEILEDKYNELEEENKNLKDKIKHLEFDVDAWYQLKLLLEGEIEKQKEELKWWKDLVHKAKEFEYDEDGMDYIWQNTKI